MRLQSSGTPIAALPALNIGLTPTNPPASACRRRSRSRGTDQRQLQVACGATLPARRRSRRRRQHHVGYRDDHRRVRLSSPAETQRSGRDSRRPCRSLNVTNHGGVTLTVSSNNPNVLMSRDATTVGVSSITVDVPNNQNSFSYHIHGLENATGTATVTISSTGFADKTHTATLVTPGVEIQGLTTSETTFSPDDTVWYVQVGTPNTGGTALSATQFVRAGRPTPFIVTLSNSLASVARLRSDEPVQTGQSVTKPIQPGEYFTHAVLAGSTYGLTFEVLAAGTTTVSVTGPAGFVTMSTAGNRQVTVSAPAINHSGTTTLGTGLMVGLTPSLGRTAACRHDPERQLERSYQRARRRSHDDRLSTFANNVSSFTLRPGPRERGGPGALTLSAPNFTGATHGITRYARSQIRVQRTTTTLADDDTVGVRSGFPVGMARRPVQAQSIRRGGPRRSWSPDHSLPSVGRLHSDEPVQSGGSVTKPIPEETYFTHAVLPGSTYGLRFEPLSAGTTTVSVAGPPGIQTMTTAGIRQVIVSGPVINTPSNLTIGAGLMAPVSTTLGASQHGGVTVTIPSHHASVLESPNATTPGTPPTTVNVPNAPTSHKHHDP